ncbi:MAG: hypothetical protein ACRD15_12500 [Vicinamibacterales bacterium]
MTPLTGNSWTVPFERADRSVSAGERPPDVGWQNASEGFFKALGIPLLSGRLFRCARRPGRRACGDRQRGDRTPVLPERAVGRRIGLGQNEAEIVGVVGDIRRAGLTDDPRADMYVPFEQGTPGSMTLFLRTTGNPLGVAPGIRSVLRALEPRAVVLEIRTLESIAAESIATTRLALWLLGLFAWRSRQSGSTA